MLLKHSTLETLGVIIPEEHFNGLFLSALPSTYDSEIRAIRISNLSRAKADALLKARCDEINQGRKPRDRGDRSTAAAARSAKWREDLARARSPNREIAPKPAPAADSGDDATVTKCGRCGRLRHSKKECRKPSGKAVASGESSSNAAATSEVSAGGATAFSCGRLHNRSVYGE